VKTSGDGNGNGGSSAGGAGSVGGVVGRHGLAAFREALWVGNRARSELVVSVLDLVVGSLVEKYRSAAKMVGIDPNEL
jgi:hypothetical protein